jgi:hypothetical protein
MAYTTINKSTDYFNTVLYTGTGSELAITGLGFRPDWVSIKRRDNNAHGGIFDVVRGATKLISSSDTAAEQTLAQSLKSFDSDGFTLGTGGNGYVNESSSSAVAWCWKAGNSQGSSNTDGSINTTYTSVNTTAGFSISKYTGTGSNATVGHGLGAAPKMIIFKNTNSTRNWAVYHENMQANTPNAYMAWNTTDAKQAGYNFSNATAPTNQVFSVGTLTSNNGSGQEYIAYCFAEIKGYSKFGSYTGNGNADGPFVYTGFAPAFVMTKNATDTLTSWTISDNKRPGYNVINDTLFTDSAGAEQTFNYIDHLSNGFKLRYTSDSNNNNTNIIYMAFAEAPLVGSNNIPCTAR